MDEVLVTGASGLVGRAVVDQLLTRGVRVRTMSRRVAAGETAVTADLDDPSGWADALRGVTAVFLHPRGRTTEFLRAVTGRRARSYADWVADNLAGFR